MADATQIQPDARFIRRVLASGGSDLKKCYQCATCSATCELAPEEAPFPRKQMIEAQWGLEERLAKDPAIWLCYNCGDCTERCPRGARPGEVMNALRREAIRHFAFPQFLGTWVAEPKMLPLLFLLPILIFSAIWLWAPQPATAGPWEFASRFPIPVLDRVFGAVAILALLAFAAGLVRFARGISGAYGGALAEAAVQRRFGDCREQGMHTSHLLMFWGFAGLTLVTAIEGIGVLTGTMHTPLRLATPLKVFANMSAAAALAGAALLVARRVRASARRSRGTYFDWFFLAVLGAVVVTGITSEMLRLAEIRAMFAVYFVHLVLVFALLLYAPYSKFAHLAYRTVALATLRSNSGRNPASRGRVACATE